MATKKDLVEAYSFSRRRLVTAFVSGAPGGREVEPARPGRTIVGGAALAVLLIAGAAIAGVFSPTVPDDWAQDGVLVVSKETGASYIVTQAEPSLADPEPKPILRPVFTTTSARLIAGTANLEPLILPQSAIDEQEIGSDIGIFGAPANLPGTGQLISTDWSGCTYDGGGVRIAILDEPAVRTDPNGAFVVHSSSGYHLIAVAAPDEDGVQRGYSYLLPKDGGDRDTMLSRLSMSGLESEPTEVSDDWVNMFPPGGALDWSTLGIEGEGQRISSEVAQRFGIPGDLRVGQVVDAPGDERLVLLRDGLAPLSDFANDVYHALPESKGLREEQISTSPAAERLDAPYAAANWPAGDPSRILGDPCAELLTGPDRRPTVLPGVLVDDASTDASPEGVPADQTTVRVQAGRGAYVLSGRFESTDEGAPYVVASTGYAFPLTGDDTAEFLGYGEVDAPVVPDTWIELIDEGPTLSQDAALCTPKPVRERTC